MIDCDMRKGRLHKIFEISNNKGLSNLLIDDVEKNFKKYIKKTKIENLEVLPSGMVPPNPSELLNSEANKKLITVLEKEYDYIIFDCVPINGLPDSLIMANLVNKAIIVCASNITPTELLQKTKTPHIIKYLRKLLSLIINIIISTKLIKIPFLRKKETNISKAIIKARLGFFFISSTTSISTSAPNKVSFQ